MKRKNSLGKGMHTFSGRASTSSSAPARHQASRPRRNEAMPPTRPLGRARRGAPIRPRHWMPALKWRIWAPVTVAFRLMPHGTACSSDWPAARPRAPRASGLRRIEDRAGLRRARRAPRARAEGEAGSGACCCCCCRRCCCCCRCCFAFVCLYPCLYERCYLCTTQTNSTIRKRLQEREKGSLHLSSHTGLMQVLPEHPLADPITECSVTV